MRQASGSVRAVAQGGALLGFALGGFFDGILLHQVLQWHHLLSGVAAEDTVGGLRFQVLADGLFHVGHYLVALAGLARLWNGREAHGLGGAGRRLAGWTLVGFGGWHILDAVLAHWVFGIHRIRTDAEWPLAWDLGWVIPTGLLAALAGWWLLRHPGAGGGRRAASVLALAALGSGWAAALPPRGLEDGPTLALFRPGMGLPEVAAAAASVGGRVVWTDRHAAVWLIETGPANPAALYGRGAILVARGPVALGCLSATTVDFAS